MGKGSLTCGKDLLMVLGDLNLATILVSFNIRVISDIVPRVFTPWQARCLFEGMLEEDGVEWNDVPLPTLKKKR